MSELSDSLLALPAESTDRGFFAKLTTEEQDDMIDLRQKFRAGELHRFNKTQIATHVVEKLGLDVSPQRVVIWLKKKDK